MQLDMELAVAHSCLFWMYLEVYLEALCLLLTESVLRDATGVLSLIDFEH